MKIDGKQIASKILENLRLEVIKLQEKKIIPCLAIILVGSDPASVAYVRQKEIKAKEIGIKTATYNLESRIKNQELRKLVENLNNDKMVHGIIIQQPLPSQINPKNIVEAIDPKKDVDGFHSDSHFQMPIAMAVLKILQDIYSQRVTRQEGLPTARTKRISEHWREGKSGQDPQEWLKSKKIVVIGKGETGGKPIMDMFEKMKIPFTLIDSKTKKPESITKKADILISAVGKPNVIKPQMIKKGAILIGIGISRGKSAKLMGDYDQNEVENIASFYTPTPGGIGPVNVAMLLKNLILAA